MNGSAIPFIGLQRQYNNLKSEILDVTDSVLQSGRLMDGEYTHRFETWLAARNGTNYAITCHSGTQALEFIARFYNKIWEEPRTAVIPSMTYVATANALIRAGWDVKICDVNTYGNMEPQHSERIYRNEKELVHVVVGLYGSAISDEWDEIWPEFVIEDAAQHWLSNNSRRMGNVAAISFDPTKNLSNYGNGGAVVTNDEWLNAFMRAERNNGKDSGAKQSLTGTNSRMSEVDCAQLLIKTKYIDQWQKRRAEIASYWIDKFSSKQDIRCLIDQSNFDTHCFQKFVIDVDYRDRLQSRLHEKNIETKSHYPVPLHEMPAYAGRTKDSAMVASSLCRRVLSLPIYPELSDSEVEYISDQVITCVS